MLAFDKSNANLLKELLYRSYVHDAKLESIRYDSEDKCIKIALTNSTFGVAYDLTFKNVEIALAIKGKEYGSSETLVSLTVEITVEKDFSYLQVYIPKCGAFAQDSLYLLFQMFSGDELHIVAQEVLIEIITEQRKQL